MELLFLLLFFFDAVIYETTFNYYTGIPFLLITLRIILLFLMGIIAAIFFFRNSPKAKWALSGYLGITLSVALWKIDPNTEQYIKLIKEAQIMMQNDNAAITFKITSYPYWWVAAIYVLSLIYVFFIRKIDISTQSA